MVDRDFDAVIDGCSEPMPGRTRTWINVRIRNLYRKLYDRGDCHTVEVYQGNELVGGLYGVSLGRAFFGESIFTAPVTRPRSRSWHLVARLKAGQYRLLDTQFVTDHLRTFGAVEVARPAYQQAAGRGVGWRGRLCCVGGRSTDRRRRDLKSPSKPLT